MAAHSRLIGRCREFNSHPRLIGAAWSLPFPSQVEKVHSPNLLKSISISEEVRIGIMIIFQFGDTVGKI